MRVIIYLLILSLLHGASFQLTANEQDIKTLTIYHDSDYSNHNESAYAMKMGVLTALAEVNNRVQNYQINFVEKDNRGNSNRSLLNMQQFLKDPNALVFFGGLHSPPYIKNKDYINKHKLLLLIPWAAGGSITRSSSEQNWIFRLSVDDTKAGYRMAQYATKTLNCQTPQLLLENTPWGKSNHKTMTLALENKNIKVNWFNWNTKLNSAKIILRKIINDKADCILFVGNALEGAEIINAMAHFKINERLPIISHWGITGGGFFDKVKTALHSNFNLHFIQSCFSFLNKPQSSQTKSVIHQAKLLSLSPEELIAPAGFIHAYDLTKILLQAISQTTLTNDIKSNRANIKTALENINTPVVGLIKHYRKPFSPWSIDDIDAHEALGFDDLCMANYASDGSINVKNNK